MDVQFYYFKCEKSERDLTNAPWVLALRKRKRELASPTALDHNDREQCNNRFSYKLQSICPEGRTPMDNESWKKVLDHAEKQARLRAV